MKINDNDNHASRLVYKKNKPDKRQIRLSLRITNKLRKKKIYSFRCLYKKARDYTKTTRSHVVVRNIRRDIPSGSFMYLCILNYVFLYITKMFQPCLYIRKEYQSV